MNIKFSPSRRDDELVLTKSGDVLTINGEAFDFSALPEGATLPADAISCDLICENVSRIDGVIHLTIILPNGPNAPHETRFPKPIKAKDGPIPVPPANVDPKEGFKP